ncbi:ferritin-like protein [Streptomyces sp. NPDC050636]|uniref:ferritin-like domain-containing protein n=1 Tax=Streptomyces sp. NPDC050636 TaxID=3154510 RepID=UPI0034303BC6
MTTTAKPMPIAELLGVLPSERGLPWLKKSLQAAVALELSTIPPYLCGMWSVIDQESEPAKLIKTVVLDEMWHMGLVCNMLSAIGGTPDIAAAVPTYPCTLPGNVRQSFEVYLSGLTRDYVRHVYMEIEMPEHPLAMFEEEWPTIGKFYDAIREEFVVSQPELVEGHQMTATIGAKEQERKLEKFKSLADIEKAIKVIKEQGEGTGKLPEDPHLKQELAHYYKFGQIYHQQKLKKVGDSWKFEGDNLPFPKTHPMGILGKDRWSKQGTVDKKAVDPIDRFNSRYTNMMQLLDDAWKKGDKKAFSDGIGVMFTMADDAIDLMKIEIPDGTGNTYGPEFRFLK